MKNNLECNNNIEIIYAFAPSQKENNNENNNVNSNVLVIVIIICYSLYIIEKILLLCKHSHTIILQNINN
jgi:hypothetical protein